MLYGIDMTGWVGQGLIMLAVVLALTTVFAVVWAIETYLGKGKFGWLFLAIMAVLMLSLISSIIQWELFRKPRILEHYAVQVE